MTKTSTSECATCGVSSSSGGSEKTLKLSESGSYGYVRSRVATASNGGDRDGLIPSQLQDAARHLVNKHRLSVCPRGFHVNSHTKLYPLLRQKRKQMTN